MKKIIVLLFLVTLIQMSYAQDFKKVQNKLLLQKYESAKDEYEEVIAKKGALAKTAEGVYLKAVIYDGLSKNYNLSKKYPNAYDIMHSSIDEYMKLDASYMESELYGRDPFFTIYLKSFKDGVADFSDKDWKKAAEHFDIAVKFSDLIFSRGWSNSKQKFDTTSLMYAGYAHQNAGNKTTCAAYYKRLVDAKINSNELIDAYRYLLIYYIDTKDKSAFDKYYKITQEAYPAENWLEYKTDYIDKETSTEEKFSTQTNTEEKSQEAIWSLRDFIRNWSCVPYVKGSLKENLEVFLQDGKLILKQNYSTNDVNILGFPEYTKTIIDLILVNSISFEENDKGCAGIAIKTKKNGIQLINKYVNNKSEVPHPKEANIREQFGWVDAGIRINKNEYFQERVSKVIETLRLITILNGNHLLEGEIVEINTKNSTSNVIKMKSIGGVSVIPCKVNGLNLNFIFDTGASNVSISMTEATFMLKNGYLSLNDIIGSNKFSDANGNISEGVIINLKEIEIGGVKLFNVIASVVKNDKAPLLLGQSAIKKLGQIKFDLKENTITILSGVSSNSPSKKN